MDNSEAPNSLTCKASGIVNIEPNFRSSFLQGIEGLQDLPIVFDNSQSGSKKKPPKAVGKAAKTNALNNIKNTNGSGCSVLTSMPKSKSGEDLLPSVFMFKGHSKVKGGEGMDLDLIGTAFQSKAPTHEEGGGIFSSSPVPL